MEEAAPAAKRPARTGSFSGVWWKLGDASGSGDPAAVERRLRAIGDEEAGVRAAIHRRQAAARLVRRRIAFASLSLEVMAFIHAYWTARRRRMAAGWHSKKKLLLLPLLAVPAVATVALAAFARFQKMFDARDEQKLKTLVAERKAKIGQFRGSHHNMQMLIQKYDPDADGATGSSSADPIAAAAAAAAKLKRTHSRLSFHIGDE